MFKTPIVLFVFNRPECTQQLFSAIVQLQPERLFIVADGPRTNNTSDVKLCAETRAVFDAIDWNCHVSKLYSNENIGCKNSLPNGLDWVFQQVDDCIILEDDCVPQPSFFPYCEDLLERYRNNPRIMTIGGHRSDGPNEFDGDSYYFSKYLSIWGWATWKDKWKKFDLAMSDWPKLRNSNWLKDILHTEAAVAYWQRTFEKMHNGLDAWDYALLFSCWMHGALSIRAKVNMINNIGFGNDATHTKATQNSSSFALSANIIFPLVHPKHIAIDPIVEERIEWVSFSGMDKRILENIRVKIKQSTVSADLKILHLATYDELGGAARATQRIYRSLKTQNLQCEMLTLHKTTSDNTIKKPKQLDAKTNLKLIHELLSSYRLQKASSNKVLHSYGEASAGIVNEINAHEASIVHLHWICNFLSIEDIAKIEKPIVWTLHDMWAFCGSEHILFDENNAYFGKENSQHALDDASLTIWLKKREMWKHQNFTIVAPSHWFANFVRKSILFKNHAIHVIPYPIDIDLWHPHSFALARAQFAFHDTKKQILFIANNPLMDMNKGWDLLQESLLLLHERTSIDFELIVVGHKGEFSLKLPFATRSLGDINNDEMLAQLYSAAHVLVSPSRVEVFSQVGVEAQACGLPVVGFAIGGVPDLILHQETGWIAKAYDTNDFSEGLQWVLEDENRRKSLSLNARRNVLQKFSPQTIAQQYFKLYERVANSTKN